MHRRKKNARARSNIILTLNPINYVHVEATTTAKEAWDKLQDAFQDSGLTRKVGLLRTLITTQLANCDSIESYINQIITTAHKLTGIGFNIGEEWVGTFLLAGLPDEYRPMIMGLENSGMPITGDAIKTKLMQDVKWDKSEKKTEVDAAMYSKSRSSRWPSQNNQKHQQKTEHGVRCYECKGRGHIASYCPNRKE